MSFWNKVLKPALSTAGSWLFGEEAVDEFTSGFMYGEEAPFEDFGYSRDTFFKAGDILEDVYTFGKEVYDKASGSGAVASTAKGMLGLDEKGRSLPSPAKVRGATTPAPTLRGGATVNYRKIGYADPRVQSAFSKIAQSEIPAIQVTARQANLTIRGGRRTIGLPSDNIPIRSSTRSIT